ncbi:MAG: hypothetical protein Q8N94_04480 [Methanoregula sp.]|nr:hypothetical protein [Methanoregula sp.]
MRPLHLLVIASIFGIIVVLAVAMILAGPALIPIPASPLSGDVKYALDTQLPGPHYYTGIDFDTLKSDDNLTVIPL